MTNVSFSLMPTLVKVATALVLLNTWVLFEELVIDRYGFWRLLPFYQKSDPCLWDAAIVSLIAGCLIWKSKRPVARKLADF